MRIPDSPEQLFEHLSQGSVRDLFTNYDELTPRQRKLVSIVHTELTKGGITDSAFHDSICFLLILWRAFTQSAADRNADLIEMNEDIDSEWINHAVDYARVLEYQDGLLAHLHGIPDSALGKSASLYMIDARAAASD